MGALEALLYIPHFQIAECTLFSHVGACFFVQVLPLWWCNEHKLSDDELWAGASHPCFRRSQGGIPYLNRLELIHPADQSFQRWFCLQALLPAAYTVKERGKVVFHLYLPKYQFEHGLVRPGCRVYSGQMINCWSHKIHPALRRWLWRGRGRWWPSGWRIKRTALPPWRMSSRQVDEGNITSKYSSPQGAGWSDGSEEESGRNRPVRACESWGLNFPKEKMRETRKWQKRKNIL